MQTFFSVKRSILYNQLTDQDKITVEYLRKAIHIADLLFIKQQNVIYPKDITKNELEHSINKYPDLLNYYTAIKRTKKTIITIPYTELFKQELQKMYFFLNQAANAATSKEFANFLRIRADDLVNNTYNESERIWVTLPLLPLNLSIGPMLSYPDTLFSVKKYYTGVLMLTDIPKSKVVNALVGSKERKQYEASIQVTSPYIPAKEYIEIGDVDSWGGDVAIQDAGAWSRPSDQGFQHIIKNYGTRKLIFENVITNRVEHLDYSLFTSVVSHTTTLTKQKMKWFHVLESLLHEIGHSYAKYDNIDERFQEYHHSFEELKADCFALYHLQRLVETHLIKPAEEQEVFETALADFLGRLHLSLYLPVRRHHGFSAKVIYYTLITKDALVLREGKLMLHYQRAQQAIKDFFLLLQGFLATAEYNTIKQFVEDINNDLITVDLVKKIQAFKTDFYKAPRLKA